jgi:hypothetical protein
VIRAVAIAALVATLLLALYLPSAFPPARFLDQLRTDHQAAAALWGQEKASRLLDAAIGALDAKTHMPPGFVHPAPDGSAHGPLDTAVSREMATVGHRLFDNAYFRSIEALMALALFRLGTIGHALPWLLPFIVAALVDGQLARVRKSREFCRHDPELFALSLAGALIVACATFLALLLPASVPVAMWPVAPLASGWLLASSLACFHRRA